MADRDSRTSQDCKAEVSIPLDGQNLESKILRVSRACWLASLIGHACCWCLDIAASRRTADSDFIQYLGILRIFLPRCDSDSAPIQLREILLVTSKSPISGIFPASCHISISRVVKHQWKPWAHRIPCRPYS